MLILSLGYTIILKQQLSCKAKYLIIRNYTSDSNLENTGFFNQVTATLDYKPEVVNTLLGINSFGLPDKAGLEYEFINTPDVSITHRFYLTDDCIYGCD